MMIEYCVYFEKYNLFKEEVETRIDYFHSNDEEGAKALCRWKYGENVSVLIVCEEE